MFDWLSSIAPSTVFKSLLVVVVGAFMPLTAWSFLRLRRRKKEAEFSRVVSKLGIANQDAEFARSRVAEQYAKQDYLLPVTFCWALSVFGLISLLFGDLLVSFNVGEQNFLLTGLLDAGPKEMQAMRVQGMTLLSMGFLGAFFWSIRNILRRLGAGDLSPTTYYNSSIRVVLAPVLALMIGHLVVASGGSPGNVAGLTVVAFLVGFFPDEALEFLRENSPLPVFRRSKSAHDLPLSMIEGLSVYDRTRMYELGVDNAQNLAMASFVELLLRTPYSPDRLLDWIGQAQLYTYFKDDIDELRKERIRTIFDLVDLSGDEKEVQEIAGKCEVERAQILRVRDIASTDPTVRELLTYRDRLHGGVE